MNAVGVDGCKGGWIAATRRGARRLAELEALFREEPPPELVAVDIPIGLTDSGPRRCDREARARLAGRGSSVFPAPIRPMLAAASHREASAIGRARDGRKLQLQCWNIAQKIREVDELWRRHAAARRALREVHPELCFALMNGGTPLVSKKKKAGREIRTALLEAAFGGIVREALAACRGLGCQPDDVLDAFAALWSAERIARGEAISLPADPPLDAHGIAMSISA